MKAPGQSFTRTCAACFILMALCFGCMEARQTTLQTPVYTYDYFPVESVYRDAHRRLWFYPWHGAWESTVDLPVGIRIDIRNYVIVTMDTPTPYKHHEEVVRRFPPGDYTRHREAADIFLTIGPATDK